MSKTKYTPNEPLRKYYLALDKKGRNSLVKKCGTTNRYMQQLYLGCRQASPSVAIALDKHTDRELTMDSLRPDIDWDYVRSTATKTKEQNNEAEL